jgi:DNA polymerase-3 subunit gamma/tau
VLDLIASLRDHVPASGLDTIHRALDSGADPRSLARQIVEYLRGLMLIQLGNSDQVEVTKDVKERMALDAKSFSTSDVLRMMKLFNNAAVDTRGGWQPSLSLELALAEALEIPTEVSASASTPKAAPVKTANPKGVLREAVTTNQSVKTESASSQSNEAMISLAEINKSWKDIRAVIKPAHPAVEALLNSCKPMDVHGDELILGFQSDTVRALMDKPENLDATQKAVADVLGVSLKIKCAVTNAKGKLPPHVSADGMVATALDHGGEIVDVQE